MKIGILSLTFIILLVFKLAEVGMVANMSWFWVTSPLWIGASLLIMLAMLGAVAEGWK